MSLPSASLIRGLSLSLLAVLLSRPAGAQDSTRAAQPTAAAAVKPAPKPSRAKPLPGTPAERRGDYRRLLADQAAALGLASDSLTRAERLVERAQLKFESGDYAGAEALLQRALEIVGRYGATIQSDKRASRVALGVQAWQGIVAAWGARPARADSLLRPLLEPLKGSDQSLKKAFSNHPARPYALYAWAQRTDLMAQPEAALRQYARASSALGKLKQSPLRFEAEARAARLHYVIGDARAYRNASRRLDRSLARLRRHDSPLFSSHALVAADLAVQTDNAVKARRYLREAIERQPYTPDSGSLLLARAYALYGEGDLRENRLTNAAAYTAEAQRLHDELVGPTSLMHAQLQARAARIAGAQYRFEDAERLIGAALDASVTHRAARHPEHIGWLNAEASLYAQQANFEPAVEVLTDVQRLSSEVYGSGSLQAALADDALGKLHYDAGNYPAATTHLERALTSIRALKVARPVAEAQVLDHLAALWQARGDYPKAEVYYLSAMKLRRRNLKNEPGLNAGSVTQLAQLYQDLGRYSDALKLLQQAASAYERAGRSDDEATATLSSLALLYARMGQYQEAEATAQKAKTRISQVWDAASLPIANVNALLARIVTEMGRYAEARTYLDQANTTYLAKYGFGNINTAKLTAQIGLNDFYQGRPQLALSKLRDALAQTEASVGRQHIDYANQLAQIARVRISLRDYAAADSLLTEVQLLQGKLIGAKHPDYIRTEAIAAELYTLTGNYKQADAVYHQVLKKWKSELGERHPEYAFYMADYAHLQHLRGQGSRARKAYDKTNRLLLQQVNRYFPALSEAEKADYWAKISAKLDRYYGMVVARHTEDPSLLGSAYSLRLQTKALLLSQAAAIRSRIMASGNAELIALFESWQAKREYLAKLYTLSKAELKVARVSVEDVEGEVNTMERELSEKSAAFAERNAQKQPVWTDVRAALAGDEAAVELIRIRMSTALGADSVVYAALVVDGSTIKAPRLALMPNGRALERRGLTAYSRSLSNRLVDTTSFRLYWAPIETQIGGRTTVYLSTDGVYNQLSLASLRRPTGGYVIDRFDVRYVSNTRDILQRRARTAYEGRTALLVGNPDYNADAAADQFRIPELAGTQLELNAVDSLLATRGWRADALSGAKASETQLKALAQPKLLHIATHGFFYPMESGESTALGISGGRAAQNPLLRSGLFLAGAGQSLREDKTGPFSTTGLADNGIITAYEVMNLNLDNTDLVVLSACETGLGEVRNGEGVYGLQRAFNVAGAKSIIMSLWRVNDEVTQELMTQFYRFWIVNGQDPRKAFKAAQEYVRTRYEQPYFWGAFVMVGA